MNKPKFWLVALRRTVHVTQLSHVLVNAETGEAALDAVEALSDVNEAISWHRDPDDIPEAQKDIDFGEAEEVEIDSVVQLYPDAVADLLGRLAIAISATQAAQPVARPALSLSADEDSRYRHHLTGLSAIELLNELQRHQARGFEGLAYVDLARQEYARRGAPLPGGK